MKLGDNVKVVNLDNMHLGRTGKIVQLRTDGVLVRLDHMTYNEFFYRSSLEVINDVTPATMPESDHILKLTPAQQELYHAAVALSEAQKRFEKALENVNK